MMSSSSSIDSREGMSIISTMDDSLLTRVRPAANDQPDEQRIADDDNAAQCSLLLRS